MTILFKFVTTASSYSLCLLILISRDTTLVTSPFFVLSVLKTLNEKFIGFVYILFFLTSCSSIPVCVHPKSTSALTLRFFPFFVLTFAYTFNSFSALLCWLGIIYLFWEFTGEISHTVTTWDLLQNSVFYPSLHHLHYLVPLKSSISGLTVSLCSLLQYIFLCYTWNTSWFLFLSSCSNIPWPCDYTCCNWST